MNRFTKQLQAARKAKNLSQQMLSGRVGIPQSHVSKIEAGKIDPQISSLKKLARAVGLEVMLIPQIYVPAVKAIIAGEDPNEKPWWSVDEELSDD